MENVVGKFGTGMWSAKSMTKDEMDKHTFIFKAVPDEPEEEPLAYILSGCVINNYTVNVDTNSQLVQETVSGTFIRMASND